MSDRRVLPTTLSEGGVSRVVACRVLDAVQRPTRDEASQLYAQLSEAFKEKFFATPLPARMAMVQKDTTSELGALAAAFFELGQVSFAQQVVAEQMLRCVDEATFSKLLHPRYQKYLQALSENDLELEPCSKVVGRRIGTVKKSITELIELGAVLFRNEGNGSLYSLTPLGASILEHIAKTK